MAALWRPPRRPHRQRIELSASDPRIFERGGHPAKTSPGRRAQSMSRRHGAVLLGLPARTPQLRQYSLAAKDNFHKRESGLSLRGKQGTAMPMGRPPEPLSIGTQIAPSCRWRRHWLAPCMMLWASGGRSFDAVTRDEAARGAAWVGTQTRLPQAAGLKPNTVPSSSEAVVLKRRGW